MPRRPCYVSVALAAPRDEAIEDAVRSQRRLWRLILALALLSLLLTSLSLTGWLRW